jgi:hypothetical protein
MDIAVLSDKNYLVFGLNLYEHLMELCPNNFTLHYLALDDETRKTVSLLPNVRTYTTADLEYDPVFQKLKESNPSKPMDLSPYHWALASFFTYYLMNTCGLKECLYCDTDIQFYRSPVEIFRSVTYHSVGLVTHKHISRKDGVSVGYYNVGVIYFRNDQDGMACLKFWRNVVADSKNPFYSAYGKCGDQAYLELFEWIIGADAIKVLDLDIGHGAPWNFPISEISSGIISWDATHVTGKQNMAQQLVFNHFSHFRPDYNSDTYKVDFEGEWHAPQSYFGIKEVYDEYFASCKATKEKYGL